jgi:hypothetical protein
MDIRIGTGFNSITSHRRIVTGVISNTVVTLSKNDDKTAVNRQRQFMSGQTFPLVICMNDIFVSTDFKFYFYSSYFVSIDGKVIKNTSFG